ncbi:MAG: hypothetical protein OdinLCB4_000005 [Candidatus Odinarchaeum yellowstonii]|uniref:Uncharacterized protein n=1 Tax=Odinarchaeota yellowstonii (strain LCB_4) TaxID=1841599 RepID=A0AAF0D2D3_ODILC|nr:MAG: hypothetical protein OdinLCB4_000005 [Candidatus Odinarchaeum yellowstonii]
MKYMERYLKVIPEFNSQKAETSLKIKFKLNKDTYPNIGKSKLVHKGLIPILDNSPINLCEEGLGFGVPILQYRRDFYFPGSGAVTKGEDLEDYEIIRKKFTFNLIERNQKNNNKICSFSWVPARIVNYLYKSRYFGSYLSQWEKLRRYTGIEDKISSTCFIKVHSKGTAISEFRYKPSSGEVLVKIFFEVDKNNLQKIYICNELGGSLFTEYLDSSGLWLKSEEIKGWQEVKAEWGAFYSKILKIGFKVMMPPELKSFIGRETFSNRHSWSGIIFSSKPVDEIVYTIKMDYLKNIIRCCNGD